MSNVEKLPTVPLTRLRALAPAEHALYFNLFLAAGGGDDKPAAEGAVPVLSRSRLPEWVLQKIWAFADERNTGVLDLEGFCVACRLCAHAQQAEDEAAVEQVVCAAAAAEGPQSPPWFEGYEGAEEGMASRHNGSKNGASRPYPQTTSSSIPGAHSGSSGFDFEAAAFGPMSGGPIDGARPGGDSGFGAAIALPTGIPGLSSHWQKSSSSSGGRADAGAGTSDAAPSTAALARGLGLRRPEQIASASTIGHTSHRRTDVKLDPAKRLGEELLEGRQKLEQSFADKRRLQRQHEKVRQKVESVRSERENTVTELSLQQCDVQHIFTQLDFSRQQIESTERQISYMRSVRQAFSQDDIRHMERTRSRFEGERVSLGEDRHDVKASMQMSQDMAMQDRKHVSVLTENAKRVQRRKMELQSRQDLLLEEQRQAEQDRSGMLYALELERVKLHTTRSERLEIGVDARKIFEEAKKLAQDSGAEPSIFAECFLPHSKEEVHVPLDPLVSASSSAWGPAAEHARTEDTSAWKRAVYRQGAGPSDAPRFSVSGANVDLTKGSVSGSQWAQFAKEGALQGSYAGRDRGHNHLRNAGLLGVPATGGFEGASAHF